MSLIYQSLQQLNTRKHQPRHALQVQTAPESTRHNRLLLTTGLGIALLLALSSFAYLFMKSSLSANSASSPAQPEQRPLEASHSPTEGKDTFEASSSSPHLLRSSKLFTIHGKPQGKPVPETPQDADPAKTLSSGKRGVKKNELGMSPPPSAQTELLNAHETSVKSPEKGTNLQSHFHNQIKKNKNIRVIEQKIKEALQKSSLKKAQQHLKALIEVIGDAENFTVIQWKAVLAMSDKKFRQAEKLFMQARALDPGNVETNVNLILCLRAQGQDVKARKTYEKLSRAHPFHQSVKQLSRFF